MPVEQYDQVYIYSGPGRSPSVNDPVTPTTPELTINSAKSARTLNQERDNEIKRQE